MTPYDEAREKILASAEELKTLLNAEFDKLQAGLVTIQTITNTLLDKYAEVEPAAKDNWHGEHMERGKS